MAVRFSSNQWHEKGFHVACEVLAPNEVAWVNQLRMTSEKVQQANDRKQLWLVEPSIREMATSQVVRGHLDALFGDDGYFLWGAQIVDREPGATHPWHSDLETAHAGDSFVSLWLPISGISRANALRLIPGSHRYGTMVQAHFNWGDPARHDPDAYDLLVEARRHDPHASVTGTDCSIGGGVLFHGSLWHGSFNESSGARRALLLQYARHGTPARLLKDRTVYPPILDEEILPSVLPLRGKHDPLTNYNLVVLRDGLAYPPAKLARRPLFFNGDRQSWRRFPYFKTSTPVSSVMICHASELMPGCMPHLPHSHTREELLIVLRGTATIFSQDESAGVLRSIPAGPGDLFYYPKGHAHTIVNGGETPVHYLMFRWTARSAESANAKAFHYRHADYSGKSERFSVDRDSSRLHHLHIHFTRLAPGERFPSHVDRYDTGIVVLKGTLSMLDEELGAGGVFFARAGELHNTRNETSETCEYIVFEFHARTEQI